MADKTSVKDSATSSNNVTQQAKGDKKIHRDNSILENE